MSSGCSDILSLADLQTAKKHQIFEAEVITGKSGGVAGGADIDYATNAVTGQVRKTLPAILRDIGFTPASFDFASGGMLGTGDRDKAVLWPVSSGGDGDYYYWEGALPKVIRAASSPATTGGVTDGAWRPVGDITLRSELASPNGINLLGGVSSTATPGYGLKFGDTSGIPTIKVADNINQRVLLTKDVTNPDDFSVLQINRNANYEGGSSGFVGSALLVKTTARSNSSTANFEWAGLFILDNWVADNPAGGGPGSGSTPQQVALYGQANKKSSSATWAGCLEINDDQGTSAKGPAIGLEITARSIGADATIPSRVGMHVAAHTPEGSDAAEWGIGYYATSDTGKNVRFRDVFRVDGIVGNAVLVNNATTNQASSALIKDMGSLVTGIDLSGATYSSGVALRLKVAQRISLDENGTNQLYSSSAGIIAKGRVNMTNSFAVPSSGNVTSTATGGGGAALPATVGGFITILVDGVPKKIPFYNA